MSSFFLLFTERCAIFAAPPVERFLAVLLEDFLEVLLTVLLLAVLLVAVLLVAVLLLELLFLVIA